MNLTDRAWQLPLRLVAGSYVLDSGLRKRSPDEETAKQVHGFATGTYKTGMAMGILSPAVSEILIGSALVVPFVPASLAGIGLLGFSGGLLGLYARTPGMRRPGSPFPTQDGVGLAKDAWLAAIGAALVLGDRR